MDDAPRKLTVAVISPTDVGFEGSGESVIVPAYDGLLGILYGHAPMMTLLGSGDVTVRDGSVTHHVPVSGGFLQVVDNQVSVLAEEMGEAVTRERGTEDAG
jgi:F-type H+-transporting ATPase subunit epsilon